MDRFAFLRGFLPGILIGLFSSVLIFSLWRSSSQFVERGPSQLHVSDNNNGAPGSSQLVDIAGHKRKERRGRELLSGRHESCNTTRHLKTHPIRPGSYLLLLLIDSSPRATELRNAIRETWLNGHEKQDKYVFKFIIGTASLKPGDAQKLACENQHYGDLLLLPTINDPIKSQDWSPSEKVLEAFVWALENVNFAYIFKTNDATFVVLDPIVKELELREKEPPRSDLLWGFFAGGMQATKEGRLAEKNWFLCTHYLPFPQGGGYLISHNLVIMLGALRDDLQHYTHDDIALGVWLSPFDGINKRHDVRFNTGYSSRGCNNAYLVISRESPHSMLQRYSYFQRTGLVCEEEFSSRLSYVYNWTVSPNRCCVRQSGIP